MMLSLPVKTVPDENAHIYTAYQMSDKMMHYYENDEGEFLIRKQDQEYLNQPIEYSNSSELMESIYQSSTARSDDEIIKIDSSVCLSHNEVAYIASASGITFGRLLNLNAFWTLLLGRLFNFALYVVLIYFSIKIIPFSKKVPMAVALLPIAIQQGMSYSYDSLVIALSVFIVCGALKIKNNYSRPKTLLLEIAIGLSCLVLFFLKSHSYVFICLIPVVVVFSENTRFQKLFRYAMIFMSFCIILFLFYLIVDSIFKLGPVVQIPDNPIAWQDGAQGYTIQYFINEPFDLLLVFLRTAVIYTPFYIGSSISNYLGWLNINTPWIYCILFIGLCFVASQEDCTSKMNKTEKFYFALTFVITVFSIILALLISWTPVGTGVSLGVQGRYFIPLFIPLLLVFTSTKSRFVKSGNYISISYALSLMTFSYFLITRF